MMASCAETVSAGKPETRYIRQPRKGDTLKTSRYGDCVVLSVAAYGRVLQVRDAQGRDHEIERALKGWWLRIRKAGAK